MPIQKATAEAKSNIAFIKWTISKLPAHYADHAVGDWNAKPRIRNEYRYRHDDLRYRKSHA